MISNVISNIIFDNGIYFPPITCNCNNVTMQIFFHFSDLIFSLTYIYIYIYTLNPFSLTVSAHYKDKSTLDTLHADLISILHQHTIINNVQNVLNTSTQTTYCHHNNSLHYYSTPTPENTNECVF